MFVMILRFIHLPKKGCFAQLLKRPTETSDVTISVSPNLKTQKSCLCVGRRSLFLPIFNRSLFSVSHTFGTNPKIKKINTRKARKPRNTQSHVSYSFVLFQLNKKNKWLKNFLRNTRKARNTRNAPYQPQHWSGFPSLGLPRTECASLDPEVFLRHWVSGRNAGPKGRTKCGTKSGWTLTPDQRDGASAPPEWWANLKGLLKNPLSF